jgi:hypothetical protein
MNNKSRADLAKMQQKMQAWLLHHPGSRMAETLQNTEAKLGIW